MTLRACMTLALAVIVSACGFTPLYDQSASVAYVALDRVSVAPIADRIGQKMRNRMVQNMTGAAPDFELQVTLRRDSLFFGLRGDDQITGAPGDAAATQEQITLTADYQLVDIKTGAVLLSETAVAESAFDQVLSDFAIVAQREDTADRLAFQLADRLEQRVAVYLRQSAETRDLDTAAP